jgi:hypothetical protein
MRTRELIARLERIAADHGDIEVMIHAENDTLIILDTVENVTAEQEHSGGELWFVRLTVTEPE